MGGGAHISFDTCVVHDLVDLVGRDTRADGGGGNVEDFARKTADLAHALLCLGVEALDLVGAHERAAVLRDAVAGIVGVGDRGGNLSAFRKRVNGAQGA